MALARAGSPSKEVPDAKGKLELLLPAEVDENCVSWPEVKGSFTGGTLPQATGCVLLQLGPVALEKYLTCLEATLLGRGRERFDERSEGIGALWAEVAGAEEVGGDKTQVFTLLGIDAPYGPAVQRGEGVLAGLSLLEHGELRPLPFAPADLSAESGKRGPMAPLLEADDFGRSVGERDHSGPIPCSPCSLGSARETRGGVGDEKDQATGTVPRPQEAQCSESAVT